MGDNVVTARTIETLLLAFSSQYSDNANSMGAEAGGGAIHIFVQIHKLQLHTYTGSESIDGSRLSVHRLYIILVTAPMS